MRRSSALSIFVVILAIAAAAASEAGAVALRTASGHRVGVWLRHGTALPGGLRHLRAGARPHAHSAAGGVLLFHGGPVLHAEAPYLIYWEPAGHATTANNKTVMNTYLADVAAASGGTANVYGVLTQYTDATGSAAYAQTFSGAHALVDTQPYPVNKGGCPLGTGTTACVTDAQLQAEIVRLIAVDNLPSGTGPGAPIYFVITPQDVNVCLSGGACATNNFCAYHNYFVNGGSSVLYSSVPFAVWAGGSTKACQDDGTSLYQTPDESRFQQPFFGDHAYIVADDLSHELSETITDPLINAWYTSGFGSEVGDLCQAYAPVSDPNKDVSANAYLPIVAGSAAAGDLTDQHFNNHYYYNQTEWSNRAGDCRATSA